ncbi:uncharacterized protein V1518DRAFT_426815 [Limtongia smithiae]|uniref:uncharacterized protein n=1 Tax=Limtongia smithiae TaxID=1125753 RepID=UPI0034CE935A
MPASSQLSLAEYGARSIGELAATARSYDFNPAVGLIFWIRTAGGVLRQAKIYDKEGALDEAYIFYMRYAQLVLDTLPGHPATRHKGSKDAASAEKMMKSPTIKDVLNRLAQLKPKIEAAHLEFMQREQAITERQAALEQQRRLEVWAASEASQNAEALPEPMTVDLRGLGVADHPELGLQRSSSSGITVPPPPVWSATSPGPPSYDSVVMSKYPTIPQQPQTMDYSQSSHASPPVAEKVTVEHKARRTTEGGAPLRTIFIPTELRSSFLKLALSNTRRKLETCGILCGVLNRNAFFVTHLVLPEQESTSDTCSTTDEESLFEFLDSHELFTLGWIHTHPTQTCFLSSVDVHTQNSYQLMLPEAVAIVCSPSHEPSWGVFRLTDPPGIQAITNCRATATFHPHAESNLYTDAAMPAGHASFRSGLPFAIEDLRGRRRK